MRNNRTILIAEDDKEIRDTLTLILQMQGYNVIGCGDGRIALDFLSTGLRRPDLMIIDLMMPHMDGMELIDALSGIPEMRDIPKITMSASSGFKGMYPNFMAKPLDLDELLTTIEKLLAESAKAA